jgi:uncharacterized protein DUF2090
MSCLTRLADRVHDLAQQVLVAEMNRREAKRLRRLSDYLDRAGGSRLMFKLLVPTEKAQLERPKGDKRAYNRELRPQPMVGAIEEPQRAGVDPDVWKIEALDRRADCEQIVAAARAGGRASVGCIILGRGEKDTKVREWLVTAAGVCGFIGFAVGRTVFWAPLADWRTGTTTREAAIGEIAHRYRGFVAGFETAQRTAATAEA